MQRAFQEHREGVRRWGPHVARKYVMRIIALQSARSFDDIRALAALRAHRLTGQRRGQWALDLTGRWRLIVEVSQDSTEATILEVSHHYGD